MVRAAYIADDLREDEGDWIDRLVARELDYALCIILTYTVAERG